MNWTAPLSAAAGAAAGAVIGAIFAGSRNRPLEGPLAIGAIVGGLGGVLIETLSSSSAPVAPTKPAGGPSGVSIALSAGNNTGLSVGIGEALTLNVPGSVVSASVDQPNVLQPTGSNVIAASFVGLSKGLATVNVQYTDLSGNSATATISVNVG